MGEPTYDAHSRSETMWAVVDDLGRDTHALCCVAHTKRAAIATYCGEWMPDWKTAKRRAGARAVKVTVTWEVKP